MTHISEPEFVGRLKDRLDDMLYSQCTWVTGNGRSGGIAAIYASHYLRIPYVNFGNKTTPTGRPLIIDIVGTTVLAQKTAHVYRDREPISLILFPEFPTADLWYQIGDDQPVQTVKIFERAKG